MTQILTDMGLNLPEKYTEKEFWEAGKFLGSVEKGMQWAIGDWYNSIPDDDKEQACIKVGINYSTAKTYSITCAKFSIEMRIANLTFQHHRILISKDLSDNDRNQLVFLAVNSSDVNPERKRLTTSELHTLINERTGRVIKGHIEGLDEKLHTLRDKLADSLPPKLNKKVAYQVNSEVKKITDSVSRTFNAQVNKAAAEKVREAKAKARSLEDKAEEELKEISQMRSNITCFITQDEYKLIRSCLHPDKYTNVDEGQKLRLKKAYRAFTKLSEVNAMLSKWSKE